MSLKCQLIISTHSPSIFGSGWGDKAIYMEDIMKFDFNLFLASYSSAIYEPFLLFLSMDRKNIKGFTAKAFNQCLPQQCKSMYLTMNGTNLIH